MNIKPRISNIQVLPVNIISVFSQQHYAAIIPLGIRRKFDLQIGF